MTSPSRPSNRDGFELAIICALPLEQNAVQVLLDEEFETDGSSYGKAIGDHNAYTLGRLGGQPVVLVHMSGIGTATAAAVAANIKCSFRQVKVAFVVGVCGGVPTSHTSDKIRLGDVIVSTTTVQVDFGRQYPNKFERKPEHENTLQQASPEVQAFGAKISGNIIRNRLKTKTTSYIEQFANTEGFAASAYPGMQNDILYAAEYYHKHRNELCEVCDGPGEICEVAQRSPCELIGCKGATLDIHGHHREELNEISATHYDAISGAIETRKPDVHFGLIACGNMVMKSGKHRDDLAKETGSIGFEMETAGVRAYLPAIMVKGVCDYADSHKSKLWQPYAAATAAACTRAIIEEWRGADRLGLEPSPGSSYPVHWTVPRPTNALFTGRQDTLDDLETTIRRHISSKSQPKPCHIVINGMGGLGKSELCLQLSFRLRQVFWGVFWIDVSTVQLAHTGFVDVANRLKAKVTSWRAGIQNLANAKEPWILILDNADDPQIDYAQYFPASNSGIVILTSRNHECRQLATDHWVDLEALPDKDACSLLLRAAGIDVLESAAPNQEASIVTQLLHSHPLALIQAGSYISRGHCSLQHYPQIYHQQRKRLLQYHPAQAQSRYRDVYATFEASITILDGSATEVAQDALELLPTLAIYGANRVPLLLFEAAWQNIGIALQGDPNHDDLSSLTQWHACCLPRFVQWHSPSWDPFRLLEAVNLLRAFALVSVTTHNASHYVSMHPLIHAWARDRLEPFERHTSWVKAACLVAVTNPKHDLWHAYQREIRPHLVSLTSWAMHTIFSSGPTYQICRIVVICGWRLITLAADSQLLSFLDRLFQHLGLPYTTIVPCWHDVYALNSWSLYRNSHTEAAVRGFKQLCEVEAQTGRWPYSRLSLAAAYQANNQVEEAIAVLEPAIKSMEQLLPLNELSLLEQRRRLAAAYNVNGQNELSIELFEQVVDVYQSLSAPTNHLRLSAQYGLAVSYCDGGQVKRAIELHEYVLRLRKSILDDEHSDIIMSQKSLAVAYQQDRQLGKATTLFEQVVSVLQRTLPECHSDLLATQSQLAKVYRLDHQLDKAIALFTQVYKVQQRTLLDWHPDLHDSRSKLAKAYTLNDQLDKAIALFEQVVKAQKATLPEEDSALRYSQRKLADLYCVDEQFDKAVALLEQVVKVQQRTCPDGDPSLLVSQSQLAEAYSDNNQSEIAIDLSDQVLSLCSESLNETDERRLKIEFNLAEVYKEEGQTAKAITLLERIASVETRTLTEESPIYLDTLLQLGKTYQADGQVSKAKEILERVVTIEASTPVKFDAQRVPALLALSRARKACDEPKGSIKLLEQIVNIEAKCLRKESSRRRTGARRLAIAYKSDGCYEKAIAILEGVVETERAMVNGQRRLRAAEMLANAYKANGQLDKAIALLGEVVSIRKERDPATRCRLLNLQHDLATWLFASGDTQEAISIMKQVVTVRQASLEEKDKDRLKSEQQLRDFEADIVSGQ